MSNLTSAINVNVDAEDKNLATNILNDLGLNMTTAINIFIKQIIKNDGIPFEVSNKKTTTKLKKALKEAEEIINHSEKHKGYHDVNKMFEDILNEN